jgi:hypothetical protein
MMKEDKPKQTPLHSILTEEQDALLDSYILKMESKYESLKLAEKIQVEIETEHLKRILSQ